MKNPELKKYFYGYVFILLSIVFQILLSSCNDSNPVGGGARINPPPAPISYYSPVWHPNGKIIGFNHTPLKSIHYNAGADYPDKYEFEHDSTGFWLINTDGTNMHRILPFTLSDPAWSPDGQWIVFDSGAQIYKMRFTGEVFDTTTLVQLTTEGRNFFPSWSPDGQWIAFDSNLDTQEGGYRIWKMKPNSENKKLVVDGRMSCWSLDSKWIIYIGFHSEIFKVNVDNPIEKLQLTHLNDNNIFASDNSYPKYSPDGTKVAFTSQFVGEQPQIWIMNSDVSDLHQLTNKGVNVDAGASFSFSPDGKFIVYTQYRFDKWPPQNGTLWIININTGSKKQLTFNPKERNN